MQRKIANASLRQGAKITQKAVKKEAPVKRGVLKRAVTVRVKKGRKKGIFGFNVLFNIKKFPQLVYYTKGSASGKRYFIPAAVEFGHGNAKKNRFMKRGFLLSGKAVLKKLKEMLMSGLKAVK